MANNFVEVNENTNSVIGPQPQPTDTTHIAGTTTPTKKASDVSGLNFYSDVKDASGGYTGVIKQKSKVGENNASTQGLSDIKASGPSAIMITNEFERITSPNGGPSSVSFSDKGYAVLSIYGRRDDGQHDILNRGSVVGTDPKYLKDAENQRPFYDLTNNYFSKTPTTSAIIEWSKTVDKRGRFPYRYQDFCFLKYWNLIPNNRLITLRRYAYPVFDNGNFAFDGNKTAIVVPIAQAVTFAAKETENELSKILTFVTKVPYKDLESEMHEINDQMPGGGGDAISRILGVLSGKNTAENIAKGGQFQDPYREGPYMNRVFGPINSIRKTKKREPGLEFEHGLELNFHYVARPIDGVNTKAIMIDIISNLLTLVYNEASFWGGDYRFTAGSPMYPFIGDVKAFYALDPAKYLDSVLDEFAQAGDNIAGFFKSLFANPIQTLTELAKMGGKLFMAEQRGKIKPFLPQIPALLTGQPVGEYHLVIGNPMNPIAVIGNLVCTEAEFTFGDELGPDDFPLELKVKIKLEHGMPRDRAAIQSMFNRGWGKTYALPDHIQNIISNTSAGKNAANTAVDPATQKDMDRTQFRIALGRYVPRPGDEEPKKQSTKK